MLLATAPSNANQFIARALVAYHNLSTATDALTAPVRDSGKPFTSSVETAISQANAAIAALTPFVDGSDDDIAGISIAHAQQGVDVLAALLARDHTTPVDVRAAAVQARAEFRAGWANLVDGLEIFPPRR